jgi:hypothetical protein
MMGGPFINPNGQVIRPTQEKDPLGKTQHELGAKLDSGKAPLFRGVIAYFPRALTKVAELSAYGANKYAWKGWEKVPDGPNRYSDALGRHITKEAIEGPYDKEIENDPNFPACILHATQVAWNALARLELMLRQGVGSRSKLVTPPHPEVREQMDPKGE